MKPSDLVDAAELEQCAVIVGQLARKAWPELEQEKRRELCAHLLAAVDLVHPNAAIETRRVTH